MLDNREREFCIRQSISPDDYYRMKQKLLFEKAKDPSLANAALKEKCRETVKMKTQTMDTIYEFIVHGKPK